VALDPVHRDLLRIRCGGAGGDADSALSCADVDDDALSCRPARRRRRHLMPMLRSLSCIADAVVRRHRHPTCNMQVVWERPTWQ
jgi:hypothetical protein